MDKLSTEPLESPPFWCLEALAGLLGRGHRNRVCRPLRPQRK